MPAGALAGPDALNREIAAKLREVADLLALQQASPYRVAAWRRAADVLEELPRVTRLLDTGGLGALAEQPGIGETTAAAIRELARTGRLALLDRLRGTVEPERLFQSVPGIGPELARRIHEVLHVETLEALEAAAHDGRLEAVPGVGPRRARAIEASLALLLQRPRGRPRVSAPESEPPVAMLLDVDREYREKASAGALPRIAPRRFNPRGEAWLPVLHAQRGPWHFTALYSNTARAHDLGRTHDWVVIYFHDDGVERQRTVVTETHGALEGRRVVRGRELECLRAAQPASA